MNRVNFDFFYDDRTQNILVRTVIIVIIIIIIIFIDTCNPLLASLTEVI